MHKIFSEEQHEEMAERFLSCSLSPERKSSRTRSTIEYRLNRLHLSHTKTTHQILPSFRFSTTTANTYHTPTSTSTYVFSLSLSLSLSLESVACLPSNSRSTLLFFGKKRIVLNQSASIFNHPSPFTFTPLFFLTCRL